MYSHFKEIILMITRPAKLSGHLICLLLVSFIITISAPACDKSSSNSIAPQEEEPIFFPEVFGDIGGKSLNGNLSVQVIDGASFLPLQGALVMVGPKKNSPFFNNTALTDPNGEVSFSSSLLKGEQVVTAVAEGYQAFTFCNIASSEVTFVLQPKNLPEDLPTVSGTIHNLSYGMMMEHGLGVGIVNSSTTDNILTLNQQPFQEQASDLEIPPYLAKIMAISDPVLHVPDNVVINTLRDNEYWLSVRPGRQSIFALGTPLIDFSEADLLMDMLSLLYLASPSSNPDIYSIFAGLLSNEGTRLGLIRGVTFGYGTHRENLDITLDIELDQEIEVYLVNPPLSSSNARYAIAGIDLGEDGIIPVGFNGGLYQQSPFNLAVPSLEEDLAGGSYIVGGLAMVNYGYTGAVKREDSFNSRVYFDEFLRIPGSPTVWQGTYSWTSATYQHWITADLYLSNINLISPARTTTLWTIVTSGDSTSFSLPEIPNEYIDSVLPGWQGLEEGESLRWQLFASHIPEFSYKDFSLEDLKTKATQISSRDKMLSFSLSR